MTLIKKTLFILIVISPALLIACSSSNGGNEQIVCSSGDALDCDADGIEASCDLDDTDATVTDIADTCADPGLSVICTSGDTNDCDADGTSKSCDADDTDAADTGIKPSCDAQDNDGYVDIYCSQQADDDKDGVINEEERLESGVNCDVCPGVYDPDQTDSDNDGVGDACEYDESLDIDDDGDGMTDHGGDCDDTDVTVYTDAPEICNDGLDNDCDLQIDEDCLDLQDQRDQDDDGYGEDEDCDDTNPEVHPGAEEIWRDGLDNDCDGRVDELTAVLKDADTMAEEIDRVLGKDQTDSESDSGPRKTPFSPKTESAPAVTEIKTFTPRE